MLKKIFLDSILVFFGLYILCAAINGMRTGEAFVRYGRKYCRSNDPYNFWASIIAQLLLSITFFYGVFYVWNKNK